MADIFISYARDDRDRVRPIADGLMAEGFSVWWDPDILPGTTFDEEIERELDAAKCALVVWSENSRTSRWVKTEAGEAAERDILIPLMLEDVKIPLAFRRIQAEPMMNWQGDRDATSWQRIIIKADALVGERGGVAETDPEKKATKQSQVGLRSGAGSATTFLVTAIAALGLGAMWLFGDFKNLGILGITFALAALAFILFRFAESDLSPHMKAMASRWLLPVKGKVKVNGVEAFLNMFEAVFGRKHLSWRCIWRSVLASTLGYLIILAIFDLMQPDVSVYGELLVYADSKPVAVQMQIWVIVLIAMSLFSLLINGVSDYFSLGETRLLLRAGVHRPHFMPFLILLDAVLTLAIFYAGILLVFAILSLIEGTSLKVSISELAEFLELTTQGLLNVSNTNFDFTSKRCLFCISLFSASLATAYITSVWLWLAVIFAPLARALVWSRTEGATFLGKLFDVEHRPFTALGYLTALFVIISGSLIWGVTQALAAMG